MLVTASPRRKWLGRLLALDLSVLLVLGLWLIAQAIPSTEAVRLRNALSYGGTIEAADLGWAPGDAPPSFLFQVKPLPTSLAEAVSQIDFSQAPDGWSRSQLVARHLQGYIQDKGPVMAGLEQTYRKVVAEGEGYCGDYARLFSAMAQAAGIPVRQWNFSFDGYGGHGHIFNEIWDASSGRWLLIDVYNNFVFVDAQSGKPLSALEFRAALRNGSAPPRLVTLNTAIRPGNDIPPQAIDYYRRGANEWYLLWGSDIAGADQNPWVKWTDKLSRHLSQFMAIVAGVQPEVRIIVTPESADKIAALERLHQRLITVLAVSVLLLLVAIPLGFAWRKARTGKTQSTPNDVGSQLRIAIVGPLPPPSGGMANQCRQLVQLLRNEGLAVELVQTNASYKPSWVGAVPVLRAFFRLIPYLLALWHASARNQLFHVFANSGWAWHLFAAPAVAMAHLRGIPVIVNYRGGNADPFLASAPAYVTRMLRGVSAVVTPSGFLRDVFAKYSIPATIISNIIDLTRFKRRETGFGGHAPHLIVARNFEPIYDIPTAIRAFSSVCKRFPDARLTLAGTGPEREACEQLATELGIRERIHFAGRIDNDRIPELYAEADIAINPSTVDNMPISILEAYASGVPVVTTDVGGIPYIAEHEKTALLVPARNPDVMADAIMRLLNTPSLAKTLVTNGLQEAETYAWPVVRENWTGLYRQLLTRQLSAAKEMA